MTETWALGYWEAENGNSGNHCKNSFLLLVEHMVAAWGMKMPSPRDDTGVSGLVASEQGGYREGKMTKVFPSNYTAGKYRPPRQRTGSSL